MKDHMDLKPGMTVQIGVSAHVYVVKKVMKTYVDLESVSTGRPYRLTGSDIWETGIYPTETQPEGMELQA